MTEPNLAVAVEFHILLLTLVVSWVLLALRPGRWGVAMALCAGSVTAFIDMHSCEVQLPALMLVAFGSLIGFQAGKQWWQEALILGIFVPLAHLIQVLTGSGGSGGLTDALLSVVAVVPAVLSAGVGMLLQKIGKR